jgi:hypothetical protein
MRTEYDGPVKKEKFVTPSVLNKSECRKVALRYGKLRTGWLPTRVSGEFLDDLETKVLEFIRKAVASHRSVGKTIKDIL